MATPIIEGFIEALRSRGLRISPAERIDASRAALAVGLESKSSFGVALKATLSKTPEDSQVFDEVFRTYFSPPVLGGRKTKADEPGGAEDGKRGRGKGASSEPRPAVPPEDRSGAVRPAPPKGEKFPLRGDRQGKPSPIERRSDRAVSQREGRLRRLVLSERGRREAAGERISGRLEEAPRAAGADSGRLDLADSLSQEDEARLAREIPAIIQQIRLRRGRRFREGRRGRLWAKRMIRESLAHGGVPFTLPMKQRRPRSPRVLVIVDVSWSVARAAGLFLLICVGLAERLGRAEFYFFVDRMVEATQVVRAWAGGRGPLRDQRPAPAPRPPVSPRFRTSRRGAPGRGTPGKGIVPRSGGGSFADLLGAIPDLNLQAPSDYGRAFFQARQVLTRAGGRDTVLVVLGDARTNRRDPLAWAFEEIAARCRRVIWLNPEPRSRWNEEDAVMEAYLPACDVACEARDLDGLARGVREILRAL